MTFGHAMRERWALDPEVLYLNHGTVGAPPRAVLQAQQQIRDAIERQPARYLLRELTPIAAGASSLSEPRMRTAARAVADFVGARADDLVFVDNTTTGVNAVLRSFPFARGDTLLVTSLGYGAIHHTATYVARDRDLQLRTVPLPFPVDGPGPILEAIAAGLACRPRVAVIDHITSDTALVLPVAEIAALCRAHGTQLLVDGAHAPGSIPLDVPALGADWYVGNLHKWAWTPRSSALLWAHPDRQDALHPTTISWGHGGTMAERFDLVGTRDPSAHLAAPAALALMASFGEGVVQRHNHDLACAGARVLARAWGTTAPTPDAMVASMALVPMPESLGSTAADAAAIKDRLLLEHRIEVHVTALGGRLWARVAAQIYNEIADFERLARVVSGL